MSDAIAALRARSNTLVFRVYAGRDEWEARQELQELQEALIEVAEAAGKERAAQGWHEKDVARAETTKALARLHAMGEGK